MYITFSLHKVLQLILLLPLYLAIVRDLLLGQVYPANGKICGVIEPGIPIIEVISNEYRMNMPCGIRFEVGT